LNSPCTPGYLRVCVCVFVTEDDVVVRQSTEFQFAAPHFRIFQLPVAIAARKSQPDFSPRFKHSANVKILFKLFGTGKNVDESFAQLKTYRVSILGAYEGLSFIDAYRKV